MSDDLRALVAHLPAKWRAEADRGKLLQGLKCADELDAALASEDPDAPDLQLLAWAVTNCHVLARRALARSTSVYDREKWEHVLRICEKAGARSQGVLRASLPTEITDGSGAASDCGLAANDIYHVMLAWEREPASEEQTRVVTGLGKLRDEFMKRGDSPYVTPLAGGAASVLRSPSEPDWKTAALLKDRTRRAIRERRLAGESVESLAEDFAVPVEFVGILCSWQLGRGVEPETTETPKPHQ